MRAMMRVAFLLSAAAAAGAQASDTLLKAGARVRVSQSAINWFRQEGTIATRRGDSLTVRIFSRRDFSSEGTQNAYSLRLQDIDSLSVATLGRPGNWLVGAIVGGGLGYLALAGCQDPPKTFDISHAWDAPKPRCKEWRTFASIGGGVVGALVTGRKRTRWVSVSPK